MSNKGKITPRADERASSVPVQVVDVAPEHEVADKSNGQRPDSESVRGARPQATDYRGILATLEPEPDAATRLFGEQIDLARAFTHNLAKHGEEYGLIGPLELPRLWTRHILNSALLAPLLHPGRIGDVGSGAGLPGFVLAVARPDAEFVLIEPMERRVKWLNDQTAELGLTNVTVLRGRAQDVSVEGGLDQLTARAVSALSKLIPMCAPLLRDGGELVLMKGAGAEKEIAAAQKAIDRYRLHNVEVLELGQGLVTETTRVVRATVGTASA